MLKSFHTARYKIDIELNEQVGKIILTDAYTDVSFADSEYRYSAIVESGGEVFRLDGLHDPRIDEELPDRGGKIVSIEGYLGRGNSIPKIRVRHRLFIPEDEEYFEDQIILINAGNTNLVVRDYRFGFRKQVDRPKAYGGPGIDIEKYRLIAIPFRLQPDGKKHDYQLDDIYNGRYQCSEFRNPMRDSKEVVDKDRARSEGWAWSDGENSLLIVKYNPSMIEFSMLETEHIGDKAYLNFGGASPSLYGEPYEIRNLTVGSHVDFGQTRYHFYEGLWRRGYYMFREYMYSLGHSLPDNYDPPVHWDALFDVGTKHKNRPELTTLYNLETLEAEAKKAQDIGCDTLLLDAGWEICEGETFWDEERLGKAGDFVEKMKAEYGLSVGFRTIGRSYCDSYPGMYRRTFDGLTGYYHAYHSNPFYEPCICSRDYQEEKLHRILQMVNAGMKFIMLDEFDWRGPCFDPSHGHPVPTTPSMHANAVANLIRKIHEQYPDVTIEAHDPVWPWRVRYLPVYYMHGRRGSFDEGWAFEFKRNPLENLLSGNALSLFYYNLAYAIPLYLHINMQNDNANCLAFWWYASTVRHLGVGDRGSSEAQYRAYKSAIAEYKSLKELYAQGDFYGIDELTHIHVLPESGRCVVNAFNLTDTPISREVEIRLNDLGLLEEVEIEGAPHKIIGGKLVLTLNIPPFSPLIVKMFSE